MIALGAITGSCAALICGRANRQREEERLVAELKRKRRELEFHNWLDREKEYIEKYKNEDRALVEREERLNVDFREWIISELENEA